MVFLYGHGVGTSRAVRIYKTYGADAIALITENPYRLARDIRGIGFVTADALARRLGIEKTAAIRARAGIAYALMQAIDEGQCGLPREDLAESAKKLLDVPGEIVDAALAAEIAEGTVVADTTGGRDCVFLVVAAHDRAAAGRRDSDARGGRAALAGHRRRTRPSSGSSASSDLALADRQREAVRQAIASKMLVITGGPGVGKTTIVRAILAILGAKRVRVLALRADRPGGEAPHRGHRPRGEDDSPPARGESRRRPLPPRAVEPPRLRPARRRRDVDGGRAADARARPRRAAAGRRGLRRRRRPAAVGRAGPGARRHHRLRRGARRPPHRGLPPGRRQPHHRQRPPREPRRDARTGVRRPTRRRTSTSSRSKARTKDSGRSSRSSPSASPSASASTPCGTCRCSAR